MSQYYFFVSSLPYLRYDEGVVVDPEDFLASARLNLAPADYATLVTASIDTPDQVDSAVPVVRSWQLFERGLRNSLVRVRSSNLGVSAEEYLRVPESGDDGSDRPGLIEAARQVSAEESPLAGEHLLGRLRWEFLCELETGHFFDLDAIVVYYLKLQLLARNRLFDRSAGESMFRAATEQIMNEYYQEQGEV